MKVKLKNLSEGQTTIKPNIGAYRPFINLKAHEELVIVENEITEYSVALHGLVIAGVLSKILEDETAIDDEPVGIDEVLLLTAVESQIAIDAVKVEIKSLEVEFKSSTVTKERKKEIKDEVLLLKQKIKALK